MSEQITYKDAGVDIELADKVIASLAARIKSTFRPEVLGKMGGFAAMFRPEWKKYNDPVLISTTDGVGTKLKIAFLMGIHDTVGIDLVAMNVNDLLVMAAEPLFFLDYFATGSLQPEIIRAVISGIVQGCKEANCALIGGETAEMPDFYSPGEYDLAGFCVGIVDRERVIDGSLIKPGQAVIGLASSGLHSNGFSLVRKLFLERKSYSLDMILPELGKPLGTELLTPTKIYAKPVLKLCETIQVTGMAHITGGGFIGNVPRILPPGCSVRIDKGSWDIPSIFNMIKREAGLDDYEMFRTFNMGVGYIVVVQEQDVQSTLEILRSHNLKVWAIGEVISRTDSKQIKIV